MMFEIFFYHQLGIRTDLFLGKTFFALVEMEERITGELKIKKRKKGVMPAMMKQKINK
jgi:hypothetical protein